MAARGIAVVKIGSSSITRSTGELDEGALVKLADDLAQADYLLDVHTVLEGACVRDEPLAASPPALANRLPSDGRGG